ncbi:MAG: hypothetical protein ACI4DV_02185 [Lachnospiraceae bacterium]
MKVIDTKEYVSMLRELTDAGKEVSMLIAGNSMSPFLVHQRDSIRFRKPDRPLKAGDMVFYQRKNGQFLMHRICRVRPEGYDIVGDAQWLIEGPVERDQIFAVVTGVKRKGKWIGPGNFWWEFFEHVWIHVIPLRRPIIGAYSVCVRQIRH